MFFGWYFNVRSPAPFDVKVGKWPMPCGQCRTVLLPRFCVSVSGGAASFTCSNQPMSLSVKAPSSAETSRLAQANRLLGHLVRDSNSCYVTPVQMHRPFGVYQGGQPRPPHASPISDHTCGIHISPLVRDTQLNDEFCFQQNQNRKGKPTWSEGEAAQMLK